MSRIHATRTARRFGVFATVSVTLPLWLVACSAIPGGVAPAVELRADSNSDLLSVQPEQVYRVSNVKVLAPLDASALSESVQDQVSPSGFMVVHDGAITRAEFSVSVAGRTEASFVMTQPTILRREGRTEGVVSAVGTLSVDGVEQRGTSVTIAPNVMTDDAAEFDVTFALPNSLLQAEHASLNEVSVHVTMAAE